MPDLTVTHACGHPGTVRLPATAGGLLRARKHAEASRRVCPACKKTAEKANPYEIRTLSSGARLHVAPDCPAEVLESLGRAARTIREEFGDG